MTKFLGQFVFALLANAKQLKSIAGSLQTIAELYRVECATKGINLFDPKANGEVEMSWTGGGADGKYEGESVDPSTEEFYERMYGDHGDRSYENEG